MARPIVQLDDPPRTVTLKQRIFSILDPVLDVLLRVLPLFIIDSLLSLPFDFQKCMQIVLSLVGMLLAAMVMLLPSRRLRFFYMGLCAVFLLLLAHLWNREFTQLNLVNRGRHLQLYLTFTLTFSAFYQSLMKKCCARPDGTIREALVWIIFFLPGVVYFLLPEHAQSQLNLILGINLVDLVRYFSISYLLIDLVVVLLSNLGWVGLAARLAYIYCQYNNRENGPRFILKDLWIQLHISSVLCFFGLMRFAQKSSLLFNTINSARDPGMDTANTMMWYIFIFFTLLFNSCDTFLAVVGMSAVISYACRYFVVVVQKIIGKRCENEDVKMISALFFFVMAMELGPQTDPTRFFTYERFIKFMFIFFFLLMVILLFIHNMLNPVLMSLSKGHITMVSRHLRVLLVCLALLAIPPCFIYAFWTSYGLSFWLLAVSFFCLEVCVKILVTLTVYALFMVDARRTAFWESLEDYVYYVQAAGNSVEFLFNLFAFLIRIYFFDLRYFIHMCMMHAHYIWQQARQDWQVFTSRRSAVAKINCLPDATPLQLKEYKHPCAICYHQLISAKVTPCHHYFHGICLRKWLSTKDTCPICRSPIFHTSPANSTGTVTTVPATAAQ